MQKGRITEGGPAVIFSDGSQSWYLHGERHRIGGPAIEFMNGAQAWFVSGLLHCEVGPALVGIDGTLAWYLNGREVPQEALLVEVGSRKPVSTMLAMRQKYLGVGGQRTVADQGRDAN